MALHNLLTSFRSLTLQTSRICVGTSQRLKSCRTIYNDHNRCISHFLNENDTLQDSIKAKDFVNKNIWPTSSFSSCNFNITPLCFQQKRCLSTSFSHFSSNFLYIHKRGPIIKKRRNKNPLGDKPFAKGVVLKVFVKKPRKPNSANRKCVLLRLSTGKEMTAYVPGIGHNLQEHNVVLVKVARLRDTPGVKLKCVRGAYDLGHVIKKTN